MDFDRLNTDRRDYALAKTEGKKFGSDYKREARRRKEEALKSAHREAYKLRTEKSTLKEISKSRRTYAKRIGGPSRSRNDYRGFASPFIGNDQRALRNRIDDFKEFIAAEEDDDYYYL